ncbi:uncharacterized protein [Anabrus simplex]|uniref:uncharacterized protein n=1 Tax=Anabrus simplex TaxID=316456 RepID=UPI0035A3C90E
MEDVEMKDDNFVLLITENDLPRLVPLVKKNFEHGDKSKLAFKLLLRLQQAVSDTNTAKITKRNIENVEMLTELCSRNIDCEKVNRSDFICCLHHICKFFISQGEIEPTLRLKEFFLSSELVEENMFLRVCNATYFLLYNLIKEKAKQKPVQKDWLVLMDNLKASFEFLVHCGDNFLNTIFTHTASSLGMENLLEPSQLLQYQEDSLDFQITILDMTHNFYSNTIIGTNPDKTFQMYVRLVSSMIMMCVKRKNFTKMLEVLEKVCCIKTTEKVHALTVSLFKDILTSLLNGDSSCKLDQCISLLEYLRETNSSKDLYFVCSHITIILTLMNSYLLENVHSWQVELMIQYYGLMIAISEIVSSIDFVPCTLSSGAKCPCEGNSRIPLSMLLETLQWPINFTATHLKSVLCIFSKVSVVQLQCIKVLKEMKTRSCLAWEECWDVLGRRTHNLGCFLQQRGHFDLAEKLLYKYCEAFLQQQILNDTSNLQAEMLRRNLLNLARSYIEAKNFQKALICTALSAAFFPLEQKEAMKLWTAAKRTALAGGDAQLQNVTVADIFAKEGARVKELFPDFSENSVKNLKIQDLLLWEVQAYHSQRNLMKDALYAAVKLLIAEAPAVYITQGLEILLKSIWSCDESEIDKDFETVYKVGLSKLCDINQDDGAALALLGNIHYYSFLRKLKTTRCKMRDEVQSVNNLLPTEVQRKVEQGEEDREDVCDVVPAYYNLTVTKEQKLLHLLKQAIDAWTKFVDHISLPCSEDFKEIITDLLPNVETAGYMYCLHGCELYSLQAWLLLYKCGSAVLDKRATLVGLSHLLEYCDDLDNDYWKKAEKLSSEIQMKEMSTSESAAVQTYWLCRSHCCWKNRKYEEGLDLVLKFKNIRRTGCTVFELLFIRSHLILSKYLCPPSAEFIPDHLREAGYLPAIMFAFSGIQKLFKEVTTDSPLENSLLHYTAMEVSEWIGELYLRLKLPRDLRCYLKSQVVCAQMMFLPTRTAQLLSKLAQIDAICYKIDDCEVKVNGMISIFQPDECSSASVVKKETENIENTLASNDVMKELLGDLLRDESKYHHPPQRYESTTLDQMSSPIALRKELFKLPCIASHNKDCMCFSCNSITIPTLLLELNLIRAQNCNADECHNALSYFNGAIKLAEILQTSHTRMLNNFACKAFPDLKLSLAPLQIPFLLAVAKIFYFYTKFLCQYRNYSKALKLNQVASHILKEISEVHTHLVYEAFAQRCNILQEIAEKQDKENEREGAEEIQLPVTTLHVESSTPTTAGHKMPPKALLTDRKQPNEDESPPPRRFPLSVVANLFPESSSDSDKKTRKVKNHREQTKLKVTKSSAVTHRSDSSSSADLPDIVSKSPTVLGNQEVTSTIHNEVFSSSENENKDESPVFLVADKMTKILTVSQTSNTRQMSTKMSKPAPKSKSQTTKKLPAKSVLSSEKAEKDLPRTTSQKKIAVKIHVDKEDKVPVTKRKKNDPASVSALPLRRRLAK